MTFLNAFSTFFCPGTASPAQRGQGAFPIGIAHRAVERAGEHLPGEHVAVRLCRAHDHDAGIAPPLRSAARTGQNRKLRQRHIVQTLRRIIARVLHLLPPLHCHQRKVALPAFELLQGGGIILCQGVAQCLVAFTERLRRHNAFFNAKNRRLRSSSTAGQGKQADKEQQGGNSLEFHWKPP